MLFSRTTAPQTRVCSSSNLRSSSDPVSSNVICWLSVSIFEGFSSRRLSWNAVRKRSMISLGVFAGA